MRNQQFLSLVTDLREELGRTSDAAISSGDVAALQRTLNRNYEALYLDYDWPHLRQYQSISLSAGERFYDPDPFDYDRIEKVEVRYNGLVYPVERGITSDDYNSIDSVEDERNGPVLKWDVRFTGSSEQLEVWPIPDTNDQSLQITGFRQFARLVNNSDLCRLDDNLVVLFSAAELLARQKSQDANAKSAAAQALYAKLRGRSKSASRTYTLGGRPEKKPFTLNVLVGR